MMWMLMLVILLLVISGVAAAVLAHNTPLNVSEVTPFQVAERTKSVSEEEVYSAAALDELYSQFKCISEFDVVLGGGQREVDSDRAVIARYREWLKGQTDRRVIRAYEGWLDFHEGRAARVENALRTGYKAKWEAERKAKSDAYGAKMARARQLNFPTP